MPVKNTEDLRKLLSAAIDGLNDGSLEPNKAATVGNLVGKILATARYDLDVIKLSRLGIRVRHATAFVEHVKKTPARLKTAEKGNGKK